MSCFMVRSPLSLVSDNGSAAHSFHSQVVARLAGPSHRCYAALRPHSKGSAAMPGLLQNHVAVVTGSGSGIGRAIALGYAREGAKVAVLDINGEAAAKTAADIRGGGGNAQAFTLDVTDRMACRTIAAVVAEKVGAVSILVNNAGINRRNAFAADADAVIKDWQDIMAGNLKGTLNVTHAVLWPLRAAK